MAISSKQGILFIFLCLPVSYYAFSEEVTITHEPRTDKQCYNVGDNGSILLDFKVSGTALLNRYGIYWNTDPQAQGFWKYNGSRNLFYGENQMEHHSRFHVRKTYVNQMVYYRLDVQSLILEDQTFHLYAFIVDIKTGDILKASTLGARFLVKTHCPRGNETSNKVGVSFVQEPLTDRQCYTPGQNASMTLGFTVNGTAPIENFGVFINTDQDSQGTWICNDSIPLLYTGLHETENRRYQVRKNDVNRTVFYSLEVNSLISFDKEFKGYAFIIDVSKSKILQVSSKAVNFNVSQHCQRDNEPPSTKCPDDSRSRNIYLATKWILISVLDMVAFIIILVLFEKCQCNVMLKLIRVWMPLLYHLPGHALVPLYGIPSFKQLMMCSFSYRVPCDDVSCLGVMAAWFQTNEPAE